MVYETIAIEGKIKRKLKDYKEVTGHTWNSMMVEFERILDVGEVDRRGDIYRLRKSIEEMDIDE